MLYIARGQEEGNAPAEMGEEESRQISSSLPTMARTLSRAPKGRYLPLAKT
jgi:hypothetical protein